MPPFEEGNTFGKGRVKGSHNKATLIFDAIGQDGGIELIRVVQQHARDGNLRAADILLARLWPRRRGRPVALDLPPLETAADIVKAHAALIALVSAGEVTPEEAGPISRLLENQRRALETHELEKRIQELEVETKNIPQPWPRAA
jgi:hypothetical protein